MQLPVHTSGLRFVAGGPGEPDVYDDEQRTNADGKPLMQVPVVVAGASRAPQVIRVRVVASAALEKLAEFQPINVKGLSVRHWEFNGRSGLSFSADAITAA